MHPDEFERLKKYKEELKSSNIKIMGVLEQLEKQLYETYDQKSLEEAKEELNRLITEECALMEAVSREEEKLKAEFPELFK